eukprot:m.192166 g.192166  ORF g.192166 m.192166 type:complete len:82 (-) comp24944_c0_seq15:460-705(-)
MSRALADMNREPGAEAALVADPTAKKAKSKPRRLDGEVRNRRHPPGTAAEGGASGPSHFPSLCLQSVSCTRTCPRNIWTQG